MSVHSQTEENAVIIVITPLEDTFVPVEMDID